jgi:hypothetical protein
MEPVSPTSPNKPKPDQVFIDRKEKYLAAKKHR